MGLAIRGDRAASLDTVLIGGVRLLAVARGTGMVDGIPVARDVLARLYRECDRRARVSGARGVPGIDRWVRVLAAAVERVNADVYARSAAHEDYVPATASLTAAVVIGHRAIVAHAGTTVAMLARTSCIVGLTAEDAVGEPDAARIVLRSIGAQARLEPSIRTVALETGDALILADCRPQRDADRRRVASAVLTDTGGDGLIVVRIASVEHTVEPAPHGGSNAFLRLMHAMRALLHLG